jgi:hypothetical protein
MSVSTLSEKRKAEISLAVKQVYELAGLDVDSFTSGIVPLNKIINSLPYSLVVEEEENLTYERAENFLSEQLGTTINIVGEPEKKLAGFLCAYESEEGSLDGCVLVNKADIVARRRFSVGHEFGHYVLHFLPKLQQKQEDAISEFIVISEGLTYSEKAESIGDRPSGCVQPQGIKLTQSIDEMEEEANFFAAELLMPAVACEALAMRYRRRFGVKREVLAGRLASEFLVSPPAMKRRLKELNLPEKLAA